MRIGTTVEKKKKVNHNYMEITVLLYHRTS